MRHVAAAVIFVAAKGDDFNFDCIIVEVNRRR
jgi:hypothetical protein